MPNTEEQIKTSQITYRETQLFLPLGNQTYYKIISIFELTKSLNFASGDQGPTSFYYDKYPLHTSAVCWFKTLYQVEPVV